MSSVRAHLIVSGKVQGVGYRAATQHTAIGLQLLGSVQNQANGNVEIMAQGPESQIMELIDWAQQGPRFAEVSQLEIHWLTADNTLSDFRIR